jgi:CubicO group peptidase (beta-lactamase class C family)
MRRSHILLAALAALAPPAAYAQAVDPTGASFAPPAEWVRAGTGPITEFKAPEANLTLALVEVGAAADAKAAIAAAWQRYDPRFAYPLRLITPSAAREGWDEIASADYEVSPDEKLVLTANAYRKGSAWTVLLARGAQATAGKRIGQIRAFLDSVRPSGVVAEDFAGKAALPFDAAKREAIKQFWRDGMAAYGIPGMAYAFIDKNGIVEEGGIGVKTLGKPGPVTARTRFMIASNTKGMTTLLLARLVEAGKFGWDDPVVKVDPTFRLGDPETLRQIKMRHLVCACTGMPRQDMEWIMTGGLKTPPARVYDLLAPMKPTSKFGEVYQYSNLLSSAAGYIAGKVVHPGMEVGAAYDRAMADYVFKPLGMRDTTFSRDAAVRGDHADPHQLGLDGKPAVGTIDKSDSIYFARPAGGAWSSAHDVALYALNELRLGVLPNGKRLVAEDALLARRLQGMTTGEATSYGMGLETTSRWGVPMVHHGGAMPGYKTDWVILPEAGIGVVMLFNGDEGTPLYGFTRRRLIELLYGARPQAVEGVKAGAAAMRTEIADEAKKLTIPVDPALAGRLAKRHESPDLGFIDVKRSGREVTFDFGSFSSRMASKRNPDGSYSLVMIDPTISGWPLTVREDKGELLIVMPDAQHEYVYRPVK